MSTFCEWRGSSMDIEMCKQIFLIYYIPKKNDKGDSTFWGEGEKETKGKWLGKHLASKPRSMFEPHAPCLSVSLLANGQR